MCGDAEDRERQGEILDTLRDVRDLLILSSNARHCKNCVRWGMELINAVDRQCRFCGELVKGRRNAD